MRKKGIEVIIKEAQDLRDEIIKTSSKLEVFSGELAKEIERLKQELDDRQSKERNE